jgi:hypothetical protein
VDEDSQEKIKMSLNGTTNTTFEKCTFYHMKYYAAISSSNDFVINRIVLCVFNCILTLSTILLNSVAIRTILKSSQLKKKMCYFLVLVLSVADLLVGVLPLPLSIIVFANEIKGNLKV